jgi:hypothetical protein
MNEVNARLLEYIVSSYLRFEQQKVTPVTIHKYTNKTAYFLKKKYWDSSQLLQYDE